VRFDHRIYTSNSLTHSLLQTLCQSTNVTDIITPPFPCKLVYLSDKAEKEAQITRFEFGAQKMFPEFNKKVEKFVAETLLLSILVCDRVSVRYAKNVKDFSISGCVT
jgi:hypothetical protein